MNVLILGASGFVGGAILRDLLGEAKKLSLRALLRPMAEPRGLHPAVEVIPGDILNLRDVENAVAGCEAVINAVGIIAEKGKNTFENIHVKAVEYTVSASKKAGVRKYILISALGTRAGALSRYHQTKFAGEETLRNSGLTYTIFQPSVVFGEGDKFINLLAKLVRRSPIVPVVGNGENKFQPIWVCELARMVRIALATDNADGKTIKVAGKKAYTYNEILRVIERILEIPRKPFVHLPMALIKYPAMIFKTPINYDQWLMLQEDNIISQSDYELLVKTFGFEPSALEDVLPTYIKNVV